MKSPRINTAAINDVADNVTRPTSEREDIDLAAEATAGAPAKSLEAKPGRGRAPKSKRTEQPGKRAA